VIRPVDRVSIYQVYDEVNELVHFTSRLEQLSAALRSIKPAGGTSLYDSICLASESLESMQGRKVIVIISDGDDTTSHTPLKECIKNSQNAGAAAYPLVVQPIKSEAGDNVGGRHAMIFLAEKTGGKHYLVSTVAALRKSFGDLSDELRTQYYLGYYPKPSPKQADRFRKIEVKVNNPLFQVRTREGYYLR
jgi:Ca-activated chloride channel family protein